MYKNERLKNKFQELANFDQSSRKHWKLLKKSENHQSDQESLFSLIYNDIEWNENQEIVEAFAENLESIFKNSIEIDVENYITKADNPFGKFEYITINEINEAIKTAKTRACPCVDEISNKTFKENNVLFRLRRQKNGKLFKQLVVPKELKLDILKMSHDNFTGAHLGQGKTWIKLNNRFYWPNSYQDTKNYVESCDVCSRIKILLQ
ncbi:unnamed protein product [Brachionus calyciflorus]|uniref:Integrase zinc-binding domain-containing protein n=1 Tax=Brachionus calyciflorus TaxID=104777 RepID=A0A814IMA6_9BILA|nr:unnamed protein product [Brachionus calyciflorus]